MLYDSECFRVIFAEVCRTGCLRQKLLARLKKFAVNYQVYSNMDDVFLEDEFVSDDPVVKEIDVYLTPKIDDNSKVLTLLEGIISFSFFFLSWLTVFIAVP